MKKWLLIILSLSILAACSSDSDQPDPVQPAAETAYKVVVIATSADRPQWEKIISWACKNIKDAQYGLSKKVGFDIIWKNEDDADLLDYVTQVSADSSVVAVVGPSLTKNADPIATILNRQKKLLFTPYITNVEFQRKWASKNTVWNMAESEIAQLEIMLYLISLYGEDSRVSLVTYDDNGDNQIKNSFSDWFGFLATEMKLNVGDVYLYNDEESLRDACRVAGAWNYTLDGNPRPIIIFAPANSEEALIFDDEWYNLYHSEAEEDIVYYPISLVCSSTFMNEKVIRNLKSAYSPYIGLELFARPESGFATAYLAHFGAKPLEEGTYTADITNGEAQLYDVFLLLSYALTRMEYSGSNLPQALIDVVDGKESMGQSWMPADSRLNYMAYRNGQVPNVDGVSSTWDFEPTTHCSPYGTTYRQRKYINEEFHTTDYISTEGSNRTISVADMWDWTYEKKSYEEIFEEGDIEYSILEHNWALLVAASYGWNNYRFGADIFAIYQFLRKNGYDDDHIILVTEDDLAQNPKNPFKGELHISSDGPNVYNQAAIDYHTSDLTPLDFTNILTGNKTERLPRVIEATERDNVFVFWSGHGSVGWLEYGEYGQFDYHSIKYMLQKCYDEKKYRKMLFCVEACYGGGVGKVCEGVPGVLFITGASPTEPSKADIWDDRYDTYLSNGFTRGFTTEIASNPMITIHDLYLKLMKYTTGSHVSIYNSADYGSVYNSGMAEFVYGF